MSDSQKFLNQIASLLQLPVSSISVKDGEAGCNFSHNEIPKAAKILVHELGARLVSIIATDDRRIDGTFTLRYLFSIDRQQFFVTLLTKVSGDHPRAPSIALDVPAAHLFERENREFFGIESYDHRQLKGLILHQDWPDGVFPLRRDFVQGTKPERAMKGPFPFLKVRGEGVFEIPVGPVHAGIIEPGHFRFSVAGEPIIHLEIQLGYVHKGIEKLAEGKDVLEAAQLSERISGDASFAHSLAFCQSVEKIAGVEAPRRAQFLRVIFSELERLYNHLGDIAGIATDVGFPFGAAQMLRLREMVLQQNSKWCGHRLLRGVNYPGGTRCDLASNQIDEVRSFLKFLSTEFESLENLYLDTDSLMDRTEGTGIVSRKIVTDLAGVGPSARASGVDIDLRRDHPYAAYPEFAFEVPVKTDGDVAARMLVKMAEFKQSISILLQVLDRLPVGPLSAPIQSLPGGLALGWAESSRGEIVHWVRTGAEGKIDRLKIKSPSFCNWPLLAWAVRGNIVPDFPLINKSFNLSYSGNDR